MVLKRRAWWALTLGLCLWLGLQVESMPAYADSSWSEAASSLTASRMLRFRNKINVKQCTEEQAAAVRQDQFQRLLMGENLPAREVLLKSLGLWPNEVSLQDTFNSVAPKLALDWYDSKNHCALQVTGSQPLDLTSMLGLGSRASFLFTSLGIDAQKIYRTFLLEHALTDQYFDLEALFAATNGDMDAQLALASVVEGDAILSTVMATTNSLGMKLPSLSESLTKVNPDYLYSLVEQRVPQIKEVPALFRDYLAMVTVGGFKFANTLKERGGWGALNRALRTPPVSSRQILHPMVYLNGNCAPQRLECAFPENLGELRLLGSESAGEFITATWAATPLGKQEADKLACELRGDRWWAYAAEEGAKSTTLLWATLWNSEEAAQTFAQLAANKGARVKVNGLTALAAFGTLPENESAILETSIEAKSATAKTSAEVKSGTVADK